METQGDTQTSKATKMDLGAKERNSTKTTKEASPTSTQETQTPQKEILETLKRDKLELTANKKMDFKENATRNI